MMQYRLPTMYRTGTPMKAKNLTARSFKPLLEHAGLSRTVRLHDLRHTCATLLLGKGVHPEDRTGAPRARHHRDHARYVLARAARYAGRSRERHGSNLISLMPKSASACRRRFAAAQLSLAKPNLDTGLQ
jgi:integrase